MLEIYFSGKEEKENDINLEEWSICKQFVNADLKNWMSTFDPTASSHRTIDGERLAASLSSKLLLNYRILCLVTLVIMQLYVMDFFVTYFIFFGLYFHNVLQNYTIWKV